MADIKKDVTVMVTGVSMTSEQPNLAGKPKNRKPKLKKDNLVVEKQRVPSYEGK
mgnify:CR=1 FL=1|tara:strand:+ start:219 stop:380 length:162 start_codon:yes stop_codon:yes gene_type:complete